MSAPSVPRVDVVVVSYNSRGELHACVAPLAGAPGIRVIVVDNESSDGSLATVDGLDLTAVASGRNGGFAFGCNTGWRLGGAPFVLFLNPDAAMTPEAIHDLADALEADPTIGAVGPRITHPDGSLDFSQRRFPTALSTYAQALYLHRLLPGGRWSDEVVRDHRRYASSGNADWISGACMMVRRSALERLGGFDEGFFMYSEDTDLCARLWAAGLRVGYEPAAECRHAGGGSAPRPMLFPVHVASRIRYMRTHRGRAAAALERGALALWAVTHLVAGRGGLASRRGYLGALRRTLEPRPKPGL